MDKIITIVKKLTVPQSILASGILIFIGLLLLFFEPKYSISTNHTWVIKVNHSTGQVCEFSTQDDFRKKADWNCTRR
tara:strand:- start:48 stop:278 length:231 start_codon:yes stop_codon:yes gene_type:complete